MIESGVYHSKQDPRCSLGNDAPETVQHITAGCKMLPGKAYFQHHKQGAGIVYRNISDDSRIKVGNTSKGD